MRVIGIISLLAGVGLTIAAFSGAPIMVWVVAIGLTLFGLLSIMVGGDIEF